MTTIIQRLLAWLRSIGSSVILLSATLPVSRRNELAKAFGAILPLEEKIAKGYPSLIVAGGREDAAPIHISTPRAWQPERHLHIGALHYGDDDEAVDAKARWLLEQIQEGGCVCWMSNTVERAQKLFKRVDALAPADVDRSLLHAQIPLDERLKREEQLVSQYGPQGTRPMRGIVIGTQVLEQSLDLDFDVMASDLAPIDLLLQRAGRMHRHLRERPRAHRSAWLWVNTPLQAADDVVSLRPDNVIYDEYVLRLTWRELVAHTEILLPQDYRPLIEAVYDASDPEEDDPLWKAWDKLQAQQSKAYGQARQRLLPVPDPEELFCTLSARLTFDEDESGAAWIVAQTRLGQESVNIIPLEKVDEHTCLGPSGEKLDIQRPLARETQLQLLRRSIRVSRYEVVQAIKLSHAQLPALFARSTLLKGYFPLWLQDGKCEFADAKGGLTLTLDPMLGLVTHSTRKPEKDE
jgi:CRISPR-associated endonuclease/helicase Cas3